jgi:hypothetical protein
VSAPPGPHHRLSDAEALACLAHADRFALLATAAEALHLSKTADGNSACAVMARNALLLAAAAVHLLLWGPLVPPGQAARA